MVQRTVTSPPRKRLSLSMYISLLLALTAILPILATIGSLQIFLRPQLISQVSGNLAKDSQTRVQLIDAYLSERFNDIQTLSQSTFIKNVLSGDQKSKSMALNVLFTALHRDIANYISISLLNPESKVVLSYPIAPQPHGKYLILPGVLQQLQQSGKIIISDVFYDRTSNNASVDIYSRVIDNNYRLLGVVRVSLGLHRIWEPVDSEVQTNSDGSYAFILDQNGVRIAYSNTDRSGFTLPTSLFKAIAPLSPTLEQRIRDQNLYGNSNAPVTALVDEKLIAIQDASQSQSIFQIDPTGQNQSFQAARYSSKVVPWTYFILKPMTSVTGIVDQQLLGIILLAIFMLTLAVIIGIFVGQRIALPILHSASSLRKNSQALKTLADEGHVIATEQTWMVEALQVALSSVKYYANAASVGSQRIQHIGREVRQNSGGLDASRVNMALQEMVEIATYIERAIKHQEVMNEKLATTLRVTTQASEQLTRGAKSTDDAALQLEQVVEQLTSAVGRD
jgi:methyl-accepting chemotaxis protein